MHFAQLGKNKREENIPVPYETIPVKELDVICEIAEKAASIYIDQDNERRKDAGKCGIHSAYEHKEGGPDAAYAKSFVEAFNAIATCHTVCSLRLCQLRDAPADYFLHDILGIRRNLVRTPKRTYLRNNWMPRYAATLEAVL